MKVKHWFVITGASLILFLAVIAFRPVPIPEEGDCLITKGVVAAIDESGTLDVSIRLRGNDTKFYVNRGLERGLDLNDLRATLTGEEVLIKYPKYWTPLDPGNSVRHISKIEFNGQTIFTELAD
jgi:hypothetical protein